MNPEAALEAVDRRNPDGLADVLIGLSEKERRSLHGALMDLTEVTPAPNRNEEDLDRCFFIALWGTGTSRDVRNAIASWRFVPDRRLAEVVAVRPRKTIDALVRSVLRDDWNRGDWFIVRDLIRQGVVEHPDSEDYYVSLARALPIVVGLRRGEWGPDPIADAIVSRLQEDDPLPGELLRALEFEEAVHWITGPYIAEGWLVALKRAIDGGVFERDVMLDVSLDGQLRDLRKSASSFFRKLLASLEPTTDEQAQRVATWIRIVAASAPSEQVAAAKMLRGLARAGIEIDAEAVASSVVTPLTGSHKGAAVEALRLLSDTVLQPGVRAQAAVHGLSHPHADIQERALRLIEECGPEVPAQVRADALIWVDSVAPSLHERLVNVVGIEAPPSTGADYTADLVDRLSNFSGAVVPGTNVPELLAAVRRGEMPGPLTFDPWLLPDLGAEVKPIGDVDELVATLTIVLAGTGTPLDLERVIDGLSRYDPAAIPDAALSPVRAMFSDDYIGAVWNGWDVRSHVEIAARHWCARRLPPSLPYLSANKRRFRRPPSLTHDLTQPPRDAEGQWWAAAFDGSSYTAGILGVLSARLWEAVTAALTSRRPTLALPSTTSGWVRDDDLLDRLAEHERRGVVPGRFDATQALLRLHPGASGRGSAGAMSTTPVALAMERFRGAAAGPDDPGLARAVADAACPGAIRLISFPKDGYKPELSVLRYQVDEPAPPLRRDDPVGQLVAELEPPSVRPVVNARWTPAVSALFASDRLLVDWTIIGLPRHRDVVAARAAALLAEDLDANRSSDCLHSLLSAASDPDVPLTFAMHVLLAMALADRNVVTSAAAADLLHDAATDGRLDAGLLGEVLAELSNGGVIKASRFAKATANVVPVSPLVAERVREALCAWLGDLEGVPRDLHAVLETMELACAASGRGLSHERAMSKLTEAARGSSKRAKSAGRLLDLPADASSNATALAGHALLDRSERWASSTEAQK